MDKYQVCARDVLEVVEHLLPGQLPPVLESPPVADAINALGRIKPHSFKQGGKPVGHMHQALLFARSQHTGL